MDYKGLPVTHLHTSSRLPRQLQRALPVYIACLLFFLIFNANWFGSSSTGLANLPDHDDSHHAAYTPGLKFPKKIWQTWKVDATRFGETGRQCAQSWISKNPNFRYEVLTDDNELDYVEAAFGPEGINRPDIINMYRSLTLKIVKADLLRYMIMYAEGGVYTDIDVEAIRPIGRFVPERYDEGEVDMVVGIEIDEPEFRSHPILGQKSQSFCQWTFMCKPRLPVMLRLIEQVMQYLEAAAIRQKVPISEIKLDFDEVIIGTGPTAFTNAILAHMGAQTGREVTWDSFHGIAESKVVGGILVLTVEAFAAGQGHSDSGNHDTRSALVRHLYHASKWPTTHPRYRHPIFGSVERCNWDASCVKAWDANTNAFASLPEDQQARAIHVKQIEDAEQAHRVEIQEQQRMKIQQQVIDTLRKEVEREEAEGKVQVVEEVQVVEVEAGEGGEGEGGGEEGKEGEKEAEKEGGKEGEKKEEKEGEKDGEKKEEKEGDKEEKGEEGKEGEEHYDPFPLIMQQSEQQQNRAL